MEDYYIRGISFFCDIISQFQGWNFFFSNFSNFWRGGSLTDPPPQLWKRLKKTKTEQTPRLWNQETHHVTCHNLMAVFAIIVTVVNVLQVGVSKVKHLCGVIQGQAIGPVQLCADYGTSCCSIHKGPFDSGVLTPVWPEHQVGAGKNYSMTQNSQKNKDCDMLRVWYVWRCWLSNYSCKIQFLLVTRV